MRSAVPFPHHPPHHATLFFFFFFPFSLMALRILFILENVVLIFCFFDSLWLFLRGLTISPTEAGSASLLLCIVLYLSILRMPRDSALAALAVILAVLMCIILLLISFLVTSVHPPPPPAAAPANAVP